MRRLQVLIVGFLFVSSWACMSRSPETNPVDWHPGVQWLSWTPTERERFVWGFIDGDGHGRSRACLAADKLFETNQPHTFGYDKVPSTFTSSRCLASLEEYPNVINLSSGPDFTSYTSVITEFYTKHTDRRDIHFTQLMEMMSGAKVPSADELYRKFQ